MAEASPYEYQCDFYNVVEDVVGRESDVKLRRQKYELYNSMDVCNPTHSYITVLSGSKAEGFDFESSDIDGVFVDKNVLVLNDISNHFFTCNLRDFPIVLLMETENVSPGSSLLRCIKFDEKRLKSLQRDSLFHYFEHRGNKRHLSSHKVRLDNIIGDMTSIHGPCRSTKVYGGDADLVPAFKCPFWPKEADSFINMSLHRQWPPQPLLNELCENGCLFVAIDSRRHFCSDKMHLEWRISFSQAEKKLVHSMNHCQFVSYGLMKIFLNDILKNIPEVGELLCSYFMKTAVFWEISKNYDNWLPKYFILKFWRIFRRIINWVSLGYCPNFFIPENNMFYGKIYGKYQRELLLRLRTLYNEGDRCLLHSSSLVRMHELRLMNNLSKDEEHHALMIYNEHKKVDLIVKSFDGFVYGDNLVTLMHLLCNTAASLPSKGEITSTVKRMRIKCITQRIGAILCTARSESSRPSNRPLYSLLKTAQSIVKRNKTLFCLESIYLAACLYRMGDYNKTIRTVNFIKERLDEKMFWYKWNFNLEIGKWIMEYKQHGMSYEAILNNFVIDCYKFEPGYSIEELRLECKAKEQNTAAGVLRISPLVLLNYLLILSYTALKSGETHRRRILFELRNLVINDDGHHIHHLTKAISWEILGICQQLCGDYVDAYQSFINALNDKYNDFYQATITRITVLMFMLWNQGVLYTR